MLPENAERKKHNRQDRLPSEVTRKYDSPMDTQSGATAQSRTVAKLKHRLRSGQFTNAMPGERELSKALAAGRGTMSHWNGNVMQDEALRKIYRLEKPVKAAHDKDLTHVWRKLQSADHFHYMQKENSFTPYASAFDAYIYYMNALADLQIRVKRESGKPVQPDPEKAS